MEKTYENILAECLAKAPAGIDTRQGSIFYDAVSAVCFKIAQYYADLNTIFDLVFLTTAVDEYLDRKGVEYGLTRISATPAKYSCSFSTTSEIPVGTRFFAENLYFSFQYNAGSVYLESETVGIAGNIVISGTPAIPVSSINGLDYMTFGELIELGVDTESDDAFRRRIQEKIATPAENGNRQHYKTWCESISGVGRAKILPLFAGENTVAAVILAPDGLPASSSVIGRVQEYIDPITLGNTVVVDGDLIAIGDGLGDGVANIGAHFSAISPTPVSININFTGILKSGSNISKVIEEATLLVTEYLKNIALNTPDSDAQVVRMSAISACLFSIEDLIDFTNLTVNGNTVNIEILDREVAILDEVSMNVGI